MAHIVPSFFTVFQIYLFLLVEIGCQGFEELRLYIRFLFVEYFVFLWVVEIDFILLWCLLNFVVLKVIRDDISQGLVCKVSMSVIAHFTICWLCFFSVLGFFERIRHHLHAVIWLESDRISLLAEGITTSFVQSFLQPHGWSQITFAYDFYSFLLRHLVLL